VICSCSTEEKKQQLALPAGVAAGMAAMMAHPLAAEATSVTPSLRNLLGSVAAGGAVLAAIFFAITTIASFDPVARGRK
jgi:Photosystem II reaction centre X protein (PsbX)